MNIKQDYDANGINVANNIISKDADIFLYEVISRLSAIRRYNTRKFVSPQSVMEHSGSVVLISMVISDILNQKGIKNDTEKVMRLAILHDIDETISGDLPHDAKYKNGELSKNLRLSLNELTEYTTKNLLDLLNNSPQTSYYLSLFHEEKQKVTIEAKIVKIADFYDVIIYGLQEEQLGNSNMNDAIENAKNGIKGIISQI